MKTSRSVYLTPLILCASLLLSPARILHSAENDGGRRGGKKGQQEQPVDDIRSLFKTEVPAHPIDIILARPSQTSITASILAYADCEGVIAYGLTKEKLSEKTAPFRLSAGQPLEINLSGLKPGSEIFYQLSTRASGANWTTEALKSFHPQRPPGSSFTFTIQADPHLDYNTEPAVYLKTLNNALQDRPDFHIDLGDTFMCDKHRGRETAAAQYLAQRYYLSHIADSASLFLVLGNHDGEAGRWLDGTPDNLAVWSNQQRKRCFPNPVPDSFYTGNAKPDPHAGLLENYYAWEWGDALFVVLDPFWFTPRQRGNEDNWPRTLGREQYDWLTATLTKSLAKFRFVFIHHLVGGIGREARGGAEAASLYEWGGHTPEGTDLFKEKRPGWPMPIHDLLVKNHVTAVFHGHDHLYVHQELDGVVYQEVPQPGYPRTDNTRSAEEYGYKSGTLFGSSGHIRVGVSSDKAVVEYVRSSQTAGPGERGSPANGSVSHRYELKPR
ncbi:MAG: metallophosphoesterase [Verrucomicrobiota bacterium]